MLRRAVFRTRQGSPLAGDRGAVTAEFVVVLPAVLVVLMVVVGGVMMSAQHLSLTAIAGQVARLEARGDSGGAARSLARAPRNVQVDREVTDGIRCVRLRWSPISGPLSALHTMATGCAAEQDELPRAAQQSHPSVIRSPQL